MAAATRALLLALSVLAPLAAGAPSQQASSWDEVPAAEGTGAALADLPHLTGTGLRDVIIASDEAWVLVILETEQRCGKQCVDMRAELAKLEKTAQGMIKFAFTNAGDHLAGPDGSLMTAGSYFNMTRA